MGETPIIRCEPYLQFISANALASVRLPDGAVWRYYDCGPKERLGEDGVKKEELPPLVCIHGLGGTCHGFFMQLDALGKQGYRVISVGYPSVYTHTDWAKSFDRFLDLVNIHEVHLYGASLGGFLAQVFAKLFPSRVKSLALSNSFCSTTTFHDDSTLWTNAYAYMPDFYLRNLILETFPQEEHFSPGVGDAIDFQVLQLENLTQEELASRVTLNCSIGSSHYVSRPDCLSLRDDQITFIDSLDNTTLPRPLRDQLYTVHPEAKQAFLKSGGDFPFLSRWEEVNMHLVVHLRRNGTSVATGQAYPVDNAKEGLGDSASLSSSSFTATPPSTPPSSSEKEKQPQQGSAARRAPPPPPRPAPAPPPRPSRAGDKKERADSQEDANTFEI